MAKDTSVWIETLVSGRTGEPVVQIAWCDHIGQFSPTEARALALQLLEAADAAESDAFLVHFMRDVVKAPPEMAGQLLMEFREYREAQAGKT